MQQQFKVCGTCQGRGSHVNRAIDGNGITQDEMAEMGPEFFEDYMSGMYDVRCEECGGNRVVPKCVSCNHSAEDEDGLHCFNHASHDERERIQGDRDYEAEVAAERRMGC